jgi:hypothetical protein
MIAMANVAISILAIKDVLLPDSFVYSYSSNKRLSILSFMEFTF